VVDTGSGFRVTGVAQRAEEAMWMAEHRPVDMAIITHRPRSRDGLWLCRELKRGASPPMVVICSAYPDAVLTACCVAAEADALVSIYDCDDELADVLDRVAYGMRVLPAVPPRVGAILHERLDPAEQAIFSMLLAGLPASDVARGLRISRAEFELRRSALLGKLETLPPVSGMRY
jgi:DNA-binding NarL/FixJ family response regulator